jgi:hypothetical protein
MPESELEPLVLVQGEPHLGIGRLLRVVALHVRRRPPLV